MTDIRKADFEAEWAKMLRGEIYDAVREEFQERLKVTRAHLWEFNNLHPGETARMQALLRKLLGSCGQRVYVNQPFRCDYGCNIHVGENFFANFNLTILDEAEVRIGDNAFIGPNVSIFTACHPLDAESRNTGVEWALPVTIGHNVWIGGGAIILPGVTVGDNVVIGAGSVVTRDVPSSTLVCGNPARPLKSL